MITSIKEQTLQYCKANGIKPAHNKGQNFLIEEKYYETILATAGITTDDLVLEVGPGLGYLTMELAKRAKQVVAVELDEKLADLLRVRLKKEKIANVKVMTGNVLDLVVGDWQKPNTPRPNGHPSQEGNLSHEVANSPLERGGTAGDGVCIANYKIVANLPYNISSVFLRKFLSQAKNKPTSMTLMLQKEVAERAAALPGAMSLLSVSVQYFAEAQVVQVVPATAFWPAPKVESAIIQLKAKSEKLKSQTNVIPGDEREPLTSVIPGDERERGGKGIHATTVKPLDSRLRGNDISEKEYFQLCRIGFSARRKKLSNNLSAGFHITQKEATEWVVRAGFGEAVRAQELSVEEWGQLLKLKTKI